MGTSHAEGEALRRLIEKWREHAREEAARLADSTLNPTAMVATFELCADELEAALAPLSGPVDASGEPPRGQMLGEGARVLETVTGIWQFTRRLTDAERDALRRYIIKQGGGILSEPESAAAAVPSSPAQSTSGDDLSVAFKQGWDAHVALPPSSPVADHETSVLQAVLDAIKGTLDTSTQIADHPNVKFAQMQRLNLVMEIERLKASAPSPSAGSTKDKE